MESSLIASTISEVDDIFSKHSQWDYLPQNKKSVAGYLIRDLIEFFVNAREQYSDDEAKSKPVLLCRYINRRLSSALTIHEFNAMFVECFQDEVEILSQYLGKLNQEYSQPFQELIQVERFLILDALSSAN